MSVFFAAAHPERVSKLILFGGFAKAFVTDEAVSQRIKVWGTGAVMGSRSREPVDKSGTRSNCSPNSSGFPRAGTAGAFMLLNRQIDVTSILPSVRVPTLVLHRRTDALVPIELGRELAALIPDWE